MRITIDIDTREDLSPLDQGIIRALLGGQLAPEPQEGEAKATTPAKATTAAAKKTTAAAKKPEPVDEPEDKPSEPDEPEEEEKAPAKATKAAAEPAGEDSELLAQALAKATEMVSAGQAKKVKAALSELGVAKVSQLAEDQVSDFLLSLED